MHGINEYYGNCHRHWSIFVAFAARRAKQEADEIDKDDDHGDDNYKNNNRC
jgi:hypothetical protein